MNKTVSFFFLKKSKLSFRNMKRYTGAYRIIAHPRRASTYKKSSSPKRIRKEHLTDNYERPQTTGHQDILNLIFSQRMSQDRLTPLNILLFFQPNTAQNYK